MLPLYIDPGTGSMLFSLCIGLAAAATFGLKALWAKIRFLLTGGKAKKDESETKIPYVIFSDHKRYWNVFKPVCDEFEKRKVDLVYYTAGEDDPVLTAGYEYIHPEYLGSGNKPYAKLNFLNADIVLSTTPGIDVYQWKRSKKVNKYVHIPHQIGDCSGYRMFGTDYYDAVLVSGEHQTRTVQMLESKRNIKKKEFVTVGLTYFDAMLERKNKAEPVKNENPVILLAPSWGKSSILSQYGEKFIKLLVDTGYEIVIRPHPQSSVSEADLLEELKQKFVDEPRVSWNFDMDNFDILNKADLMISDYSSVMYDFSFFFNKPFIYAIEQLDLSPYDSSWLDEESWTFAMLPKLGVKLEKEKFNDIKSIIDDLLNNPKTRESREQIIKEAWCYPGEAGKRIADYMLENSSQK